MIEKSEGKKLKRLNFEPMRRIRIVLFLVPILLIAYYVYDNNEGQIHFPIMVPFSPSVSGNIKSIDVPVKDHRTYWLSFGISFSPNDKSERQRVMDLLHLVPKSENSDTKKNLLKLKVLVTENDKQGHKKIVDESIVNGLERTPLGGSGHGHDFAQVTFYTVALRPGSYNFQIEVLEGNIEFSKDSAYLQVGFHPKSNAIQ